MDAAAALTFYGILALCPFVLFVVAAASVVIRPAQVEALGAALARNAPPALAPILLARLAELTSRPRVGVLTFGALAAVWSSTAGVASLVSALNVAYGVSERRPLWKVYALALATMLGAALLALLASVLAVAAPLVAEHLDVPWRSMVGWLRIPAATFVMMVVWAAVYYLLPNVTQTIPSILPGARRPARLDVVVVAGVDAGRGDQRGHPEDTAVRRAGGPPTKAVAGMWPASRSGNALTWRCREGDEEATATNRRAVRASLSPSFAPSLTSLPALRCDVPTPDQGVLDRQHNDCPDDRHEHAPDIEAVHASRSHEAEQEAADYRADDSEQQVENDSFACLVDNLARDETCNETEDDPCDD
jgi:YihY family inner membrane protein